MKAKNIIQFIMCISLGCSTLLANVHPAFAQNAAEERVDFSLLSQSEIGLQGPLDTRSFRFNLPATWELLEGGQLHLNFDVSFNAGSAVGESSSQPIAGYLQVTLNNTPLGTITLDKRGENTVDLTIYLSTWQLKDPTASHDLEFNLRSPGPCNTTSMTNASPLAGLNVIIHPTSYFLLPHRSAPMTADLRRLPYPLYQDSFVADQAFLVMPDHPTELELQAAFTTSAVFGRLSDGNLVLETSTISKLDPARFADSHIIFVGQPSAFPQLDKATWPAPIKNETFENPLIEQNDGVIQMAVSPENPGTLWLMVSGLSDAGVLKAAQGLGTVPDLRVDKSLRLSIITTVQDLPESASGEVDSTFAELGYDNQELWGPGLRYLEYIFHVPSGQEVTTGSYLDLVFTHSAMLDFEGAGVGVSLNGDYIGSFRFSEQTAQISNWHLNLPSSSFKEGENHLLLSANLVTISSCLPTNQLWFSSRADSVLHMPLAPASDSSSKLLLQKYPAPFAPSLDETTFIVSGNDPDSWSIASSIAYDLGWKTNGSLTQLEVALAESVPDSIRKDRDLLVVGRPSSMPIMQELASSMPAPFENASDVAREPETDIAFRLATDAPVGYLEVFPAPWDSQRSIITVSGNGTDGLRWAAEALIVPEKFSQLRGNLAIVYADQIISAQVGSNQTTVFATPIAPAQTAPAVQEPAASTPAAPALNIMAITSIVIVALLVLGFLVWRIVEQRQQT